MMRRLPLLLTLAAALAGCASASKPLPVCDGKHRRPANPNGSVFVPAPPPTSAPAPSTPAPKGCGS